jgi:hypothetical protein
VLADPLVLQQARWSPLDGKANLSVLFREFFGPLGKALPITDTILLNNVVACLHSVWWLASLVPGVNTTAIRDTLNHKTTHLVHRYQNDIHANIFVSRHSSVEDHLESEHVLTK